MLPDSLWQLRPPPPPPPLSSSVLHLLVLLSLHAARAPRSRLSASQQRLERSREPARPASTLHRAARAGCHRGCQSLSAGLNPLSLSLAVEACTCHGELEN